MFVGVPYLHVLATVVNDVRCALWVLGVMLCMLLYVALHAALYAALDAAVYAARYAALYSGGRGGRAPFA